MSYVKQVIVMRKDLGMPKGKMISQGAHASMKFILDNSIFSGDEEYFSMKMSSTNSDVIRSNRDAVELWMVSNFKKICVYVDSEEQLLSVIDLAEKSGLIVSKILDSGLTCFNGVPTLTCAAIGPAFEDQLVDITDDLKLLF